MASRRSLLAALPALSAGRCAATVPAVWPVPQSMEASGGPVALASSFHFVADAAPPSALLQRALARYEDVLGSATGSVAPGAATLSVCTVRARSSSEELFIATDVSYTLNISSLGGGSASCVIDAPTVFGCLGALETFAQLANGTRALAYDTVVLADRPDFVHRGVMVDSGRRFWPPALLRNVVDVMAASKLNVLHLHASDMCRWAVESELYPELTSNLSSGDARLDTQWAAGAGFYTRGDVTALAAYARDRGVRVVPEFDMPGHAAGMLALKGRGLEFCNPPFTNGSHIPNWCTFKGGNGTAAQQLLPPLIEEMMELFGGELYHLGGDETRCGGAGDFERLVIATVEKQGKTAMAWSEVAKGHAASPSTVIQAWSSPNASALAARGVSAVESNPGHFYLSSGGSKPDVITGQWVDLWQGANGTAARKDAATRARLLGGEVALWTDQYSYINDCVRPGDGPGPSAVMWNRTRDEEFSRSVGGLLWPRGFLAAGSFWNYRPELGEDELIERVLRQHSAMVAQRGGHVCPAGCACDAKHACGVPYVAPQPTPRPAPVPPPAPTPPPVPSGACSFTQGAGLSANDAYRRAAASKEVCCGICRADPACSGAVSFAGTCHVKHGKPGKVVTGRASTSYVCVPAKAA